MQTAVMDPEPAAAQEGITRLSATRPRIDPVVAPVPGHRFANGPQNNRIQPFSEWYPALRSVPVQFG